CASSGTVYCGCSITESSGSPRSRRSAMLGLAAASSTTWVSAGRLLCPRSGRVRRSSEAGLIDNVSMSLILPGAMAEQQPPGHTSDDDQITRADDDLRGP